MTNWDARLAIRTVQGFTLGIHVLLCTAGVITMELFKKKKLSGLLFSGIQHHMLGYL
jgi:hypothetical protein